MTRYGTEALRRRIRQHALIDPRQETRIVDRGGALCVAGMKAAKSHAANLHYFLLPCSLCEPFIVLAAPGASATQAQQQCCIASIDFRRQRTYTIPLSTIRRAARL